MRENKVNTLGDGLPLKRQFVTVLARKGLAMGVMQRDTRVGQEAGETSAAQRMFGDVPGLAGLDLKVTPMVNCS